MTQPELPEASFGTFGKNLTIPNTADPLDVISAPKTMQANAATRDLREDQRITRLKK